MRILVVGGSPEVAAPGLLRDLALRHDRVVAVDRGLDALVAAGLTFDLFCGDVDSVSESGAELVHAAESGSYGGGAPCFEVERYNPAKDYTDLSLALRAIRERWTEADLTATSLSGGSPDHYLASLGCLLSWGGSVRLEENTFHGCLMHPGDTWRIRGRAGCRFSFVTLSPTAEVSEAGMRWELDHERTTLLGDLGISNVLEEDAVITCHAGRIAAWVFR